MIAEILSGIPINASHVKNFAAIVASFKKTVNVVNNVIIISIFIRKAFGIN